MKIVNTWTDYKLLEMSEGQKLEKWGNIILSRPDPQIIWSDHNFLNQKADAIYHRSKTGGGSWEIKNKIPDKWQVKYKDLIFNIKLMGFKHTGIFPEQAYNWDYMMEKIKNSGRDIKVLNLFAYTGGATIACLKAGASVVHVDSSKGMVAWAKENVKSSHLEDREVHFIIDDCIKFVEREIRRGHKYDAIIMDPPSFGRGANKEVWNIEKSLYKLINLCIDVLSNKPLFFLINSYTTGLSPKVLENILNLTINKKYLGKVTSDEIGIEMENSTLILPCGIYGRWESND